MKKTWYIQCPSGRKIYGHPSLLKYGLDWVNIIGLIIVIFGGIIIFNYIL
jgi:hypothetical protein